MRKSCPVARAFFPARTSLQTEECALWSPLMMDMADGDGQGVGSVMGLRNRRQSQKDFHHLLYLMFFRFDRSR